MIPNSLIEGKRNHLRSNDPELHAYLSSEWNALGTEWITKMEGDQEGCYERRHRPRKRALSPVDGHDNKCGSRDRGTVR
jgi:hypothetical protein